MEFVDTHCHIHEAATDEIGDQFMHDKWLNAGISDPQELIDAAAKADVHTLICVGCSLHDSQMALALAQKYPHCWASMGIHPHEAKDHLEPKVHKAFKRLLSQPKVVAIGECGLDYYYSHSPKADQIKLLEFQLGLAEQHNLPVIFHIREAFKDFWPIFDTYKGLRGVVHSFSSNQSDLDNILSRGLFVGLNGITTFTKSQEQLEAVKKIPLDRLLLETDAPFLTPVPYRGKVGEPKYVRVVAEFLAHLRREPLELLANVTTNNALGLFNLR